MTQRITATIIAILILTGAAMETMAADEKGAGQDNSPTPILSLTIHCDQTGLMAGDEIAVTFVIKNEGDQPYVYPNRDFDRSGRMEEFKLTAIDKNGTAIADPRAKPQTRIGGGPVGQAILAPGKSFARIIYLNRWALVTKAGGYQVTGIYNARGKEIISAPVEIVIQPRSDQEMGDYIKELSLQLKSSLESDKDNMHEHDELVQKLVFTCDNRIVPAMIDAMYDSTGGNMDFWSEEALSCYLPSDDRTTAALVAAATNRGMAAGMFSDLRICRCPPEEIKKLIAISISADHPGAWPEGALAAQEYCDDSFTPRLIAIAMDKKGDGTDQAIFALAMNRTDESVAALKLLLQKNQAPRPYGRPSIGEETAQAIRSAYLYRGNSEGSKLRPDDFGPEYQHSK